MIFTFDILESLPFCSEFLDSFNSLIADPYLKHKYPFRKRSFSKFLVSNTHHLSLVDDHTFSQPERINSYSGGLIRVYPSICPLTVSYISSFILHHQSLFSSLSQGCPYEIGVHQIRITCLNMNEGFPVPEGHHQDGFDYVCIIPVSHYAMWGGSHSIRFGSQNGPELLDLPLSSNQSLILNDRHVFHYASPIFPKFTNIEGTRDSLVLTIKL